MDVQLDPDQESDSRCKPRVGLHNLWRLFLNQESGPNEMSQQGMDVVLKSLKTLILVLLLQTHVCDHV